VSQLESVGRGGGEVVETNGTRTEVISTHVGVAVDPAGVHEVALVEILFQFVGVPAELDQQNVSSVFVYTESINHPADTFGHL